MRTFTETEVNDIVRKRLARVKPGKLATVPDEEVRASNEDLVTRALCHLTASPSCGLDRWIKGTREDYNCLLERVEELRATGAEERAITELEDAAEKLKAKIEEIEALRNADLKPVEPEYRTNTEQEREQAIRIGFMPEEKRKHLIEDAKRRYQKPDPVADVLYKLFKNRD